MKKRLPLLIGAIILLAFIASGLYLIYRDINDSSDNADTGVSTSQPTGVSMVTTDAIITSSESLTTDTTVHTHVADKTETFISEASCTESGKRETVVKCACGHEMSHTTEELPALGHSYKSSTVNPTCLEDGYIEYKCERCGDTYTEAGDDLGALGHNYQDGICTRCRAKDPDYVKVYSSKEIVKLFEAATVVNTDGYHTCTGTDKISVFAKDRTDCIYFYTAMSLNIWGNYEQYVTYNVEDISKSVPVLYFDVGGKTGSEGDVLIEVFVDSTDGEPEKTFNIECSAYPTSTSINIKNAKSLTFRVNNNSGHENTIVFFGFSSAKP